MIEKKTGLSRRSFVKGSALASLAAGIATTAPVFREADAASGKDEPKEEVIWNACASCGVCTCPQQFHVVDGVIAYVETDNTGGNEFGDDEVRACLRGRSVRKYINHPDRIIYPMKRVGKRGEGKFERISWDEAIDLFYTNLKRVIDTYGNDAVFENCAGGTHESFGLGGEFARFMNLIGGYLRSYGTDSETQAEFAAGFMLHGCYSKGSGAEVTFPAYGIAYNGASPAPVVQDSDLVVMFGSSAATSRIGGGSIMYEFAKARENGARFIWIDPRRGEESAGRANDEWLPIRPGTDGALAAALCHTMFKEGLADEEFLHSHTVGIYEETMPASAKGMNKTYLDYLMGTGYDKVEKTAEWASPITGIPSKEIKQLARDICNAKACYIGNGVGVQRRQNGESGAASVMMIPIVSGQWGLPGTSTGLKPPCSTKAIYWPGFKATQNSVDAIIPVTKRIEAVERGHEMTSTHDGILGVDHLSNDIKFIYNHACNMLANQNSDVNWAASILEDESKCEYIVGSDWFLSSSAKYCDLLLPEIMPQEGMRITSLQTGASIEQLVYGQQVQEAPGECRSEFEWLSDLAERFGIKDQYTDNGSNPNEKTRLGYEMIRSMGMYPGMPTLEEGIKMGVWTRRFNPSDYKPTFADFRADPEGHPLKTPSGKIEVYSEGLQHIADTWEFDDPQYDKVNPIPMYQPDFEGYEDKNSEYPLQVFSWKSKIRYHSKFDQIEWLRQASRHTLWINPIDADARGIKNGDKVRIFNSRGTVEIEARVTERIIPGAVAMEEGRNRDIDDNGIDKGCVINTLVSHHWSPLAKHNPSNSIRAQVEKL